MTINPFNNYLHISILPLPIISIPIKFTNYQTVYLSTYICNFPNNNLNCWVNISLTVYGWNPLSICLSMKTSVYRWKLLSICLSMQTSVYLSIDANLCLSVYRWKPLSICLSMKTSVYLAIVKLVYLVFIHLIQYLLCLPDRPIASRIHIFSPNSMNRYT